MAMHSPYDVESLRRRLYSPGAIPKPARDFQFPGGPTLKTKINLGMAYLFPFEFGRRAKPVRTAQEQMNLLMDGGPDWPKWRYPNGKPWKPLIENGCLDKPTSEALTFVQLLFGLPSCGELCPATRAILYPHLKLCGHLEIADMAPTPPPPRLPPYPKLKLPPMGPTPPPKGEEEEKSWIPKISLTTGFGITQPLYVGKTASGEKPPRSSGKLTGEFKYGFELLVPSSLAIGHGHLTINLGVDFGVALKKHGTLSAIQGTFGLILDDVFKHRRFSISPYLRGTIVREIAEKNGPLKWGANGGAEFRFELHKHALLKATGGVGLVGRINGGEEEQPKMVVPLDANVLFEVPF
jgi:hypothetical protein